MCKDYLRIKGKENNLPFKTTKIGSWWGTDNNLKKQCEIDIVAFDDTEYSKSIIYCECKFRNELTNIKVLNELIDKSQVISTQNKKYYILFSKRGFTKEVEKIADENENIILVTLDELYL
jgi:predicted Mrr-cat superfamily restriction endonuclease